MLNIALLLYEPLDEESTTQIFECHCLGTFGCIHAPTLLNFLISQRSNSAVWLRCVEAELNTEVVALEEWSCRPLLETKDTFITGGSEQHQWSSYVKHIPMWKVHLNLKRISRLQKSCTVTFHVLRTEHGKHSKTIRIYSKELNKYMVLWEKFILVIFTLTYFL